VNLICGERQRWWVAALFSILRSVTLIDVLEREWSERKWLMSGAEAPVH